MFDVVFNRFDHRYEEAARDLGATPWQTVRYVVLPIIAPSLVGIGLFGFTLSWDEVARSSQALGSDQNTLPLELTGLTKGAVADLVAALAGGRPDGSLLRLADGAAGNPLYVTELVAALSRRLRAVNPGRSPCLTPP